MIAKDRLLITGVGGMEGRVLASLARRQGLEVSGTYHKNLPPEIGNLEKQGAIRLYQVDLRDPDETIRVFLDSSPHRVFHLAGHALDSSSLSAKVYSDNMDIFSSVLSGLAVPGVSASLVLASSIVVYGRPQDNETITEKATELLPEPARDREFYRSSKVDQEKALAKTDLYYVIVRPTQHIGAGRIPGVVEVDIADRINDILEGKTDRIEVRNKLAEIDMLDVRDVAAAYLDLADLGRRRGIYNVSSEIPINVESLAKKLLLIAGLPQGIPVVSTGNEQVTYCRVSSWKLRSLGWHPRHELTDALRVFWQDRQAARGSVLV